MCAVLRPRTAATRACRQSSLTKPTLPDTKKVQIQPRGALMVPAQPHNAACAPRVLLQPCNVCSINHSIHPLGSSAALDVLTSLSTAVSSRHCTDSWGREKVIPGTELTARPLCQFSEPDFPLFCFKVTFLFPCLKTDIVKKNG